jgi:hypothetical protein
LDKTYWLGRKRAQMLLARSAASSEARLAHYDLAGRYSVMAAQLAPFMHPLAAPSPGEGERAHLHPPALPHRPPTPPRPTGERS